MNQQNCSVVKCGGRTALGWLVLANSVAVVATGVFFRAWRLNHVPGINGDEAWMGVQALRWLHGEVWFWRTPTGNLVNVFHLGPQILLHAWLPPSIVLLRLPVLICGVLALPLNYLLCRRVFSQTTAVVSTLILTVMPINIAYSRFAWDASQSVLFTLVVVYTALLVVRWPRQSWRWLLGCVIALAAAIIVHPTNIFLTPLVVVAAGYRWRAALKGAVATARSHRGWQVVALLVGVAGALGLWLSEQWLPATWTAWTAGLTLQPQLFARYVRVYADLFSGVSVYQHISGAQADTTEISVRLYRLAGGIVLGVAAYGMWRGWLQQRCAVRGVFYVGAAVSVAAFVVVAGPRAVVPGYERYSMCLIVPGALWLAEGLGWWLRRYGTRAAACCLAVAWLMLAGYWLNYLSVFQSVGGSSHRTFRTAEVEPKWASVLAITSYGSQQHPAQIVATEWWTYWPLKYLTYGDAKTQVIDATGYDLPYGDPAWARDLEAAARPVDMVLRRDEGPTALAEGRVYFVEFYDSDVARATTARLQAEGYVVHASSIADAAGRPLVSIMRAGRP